MFESLINRIRQSSPIPFVILQNLDRPLHRHPCREQAQQMDLLALKQTHRRTQGGRLFVTGLYSTWHKLRLKIYQGLPYW